MMWKFTVKPSLGKARPIRMFAGQKVSDQGFTLIEMMVVVAIVAILALVTIPSLATMLNDLRQRSVYSLLLNDMHLARNEAIKRNARVLICAGNEAKSDCAQWSSWQSGWVVCVEGTVEGSCAPESDQGPNPVAVRSAVDSSILVTSLSGVLRFFGDSGSSSGLVVVGGVWNGASSKIIDVSASGSIASQ